MATHSTEALQQRFGIPDVVRFEDGPNGLVRVRVTAPAAEAEIYLHGGHVTHYQPRGGRPVLFVSARSRYDAKSAIRGGVPVIFPWFGAKADDPAAPQHGFVRATAWDVESVERVAPDAVTLVLRLDASDATRAVWPHRFVLRHRIGIGAALDLALEVDNGSAEPIAFEEALHTYLAVGDVREASVTGLAGTTYIDKTDGMTRKRRGPEPLRLAGETDSVYVFNAGHLRGRRPGRTPAPGRGERGIRYHGRVESVGHEGQDPQRPRRRRVAGAALHRDRERRRQPGHPGPRRAPPHARHHPDRAPLRAGPMSVATSISVETRSAYGLASVPT